MKLLASSSAWPPHNSDLRKESASVPYTETNYALDQNLQTINGLWQLESRKSWESRPTPFLIFSNELHWLSLQKGRQGILKVRRRERPHIK